MANSRIYHFLKQTFIGRIYRYFKYDRVSASRDKALLKLKKYYKIEITDEKSDEIINDMLDASKKFKFDFDEYFIYNLNSKNDSERYEFISDREHLDIVAKINKARNEFTFDNKGETYNKFKNFYKRDVFIGKNKHIKKEFYSFINKHKKFIVKPLSNDCGRGIQIFDYSNRDTKKDTLVIYNELINQYKKGFIAEEIIIQDKKMMKLHPKSVNTVRITTLRMDDEIIIIHPFMRVGRGNNVVDNGARGGIICAINEKNGVIVKTVDEDGKKYDVHPDTGEKLLGFSIPKWNDAIALAKELAMIIPSNRYTGWDLALTNDGWVMVEGNARGQFVGWQITYQKGFRSEMNEYLKKLNLK